MTGEGSPGGYTGESGRKATADKIIAAIDREREKLGVSTRGDQNRSLDWNNPRDRQLVRQKFQENGDVDEALLPGFGPKGFGENARDSCGDPHPFVCDSCGNSVDIGNTCGLSVCTRCGVTWVRDLAINKAAKIRRVRREKHQHSSDKAHQKAHHAVISAPCSWYFDCARAGLTLKEAQELTQDIVKNVLKELRSPGVLVRHSFRGKHEDGSIKSESDDRGAWKERLNSDRAWYGDVRDQLAWKPHYHCIVVADYLRGGELVERVEEATGWVIHRIADEDTGISLEDDGAMARALTYCLSHADIDVRDDANNRSMVWEVGTFQGDPIKSTARFKARPGDIDWADSCVRRIAQRTLGLHSTTTRCGATIPPVDDADELARRILEEIYPQDAGKRADVDTDAILHHVSEGNINVDVTTTSDGGGNVTVRDAFGHTVGDAGWGSFDSGTWSTPSTAARSTDASAVRTLVDDDQDDDCGCEDDHDRGDDADDQGAEECDGQLIPLDEARQRGLLNDPEWCREAAHVDEAHEADLEWPDDLEPWQASSPGDAIGAG